MMKLGKTKNSDPKLEKDKKIDYRIVTVRKRDGLGPFDSNFQKQFFILKNKITLKLIC